MSRTQLLLFLLTSSLSPTLAARSQAANEDERLPGLAHLGERIVGVGEAYRALFDETGFSFQPALGRSAPATRTVSFQLESIRVGDTELPLELDAVPQVMGATVSYQRSALTREVYEVRWEGVEQTFVFESLPRVAGDLVIEGTLGGDLSFPQGLETSAGLSGDAGPFGRVRISNVLGFDAAGRSVQGSMRVSSDGNSIGLVLPGEFLENIELPLVVDPIYTPETSLSANFESELDTDIAFDGLLVNQYTTVWERWYSGLDSDILGQRLNLSGSPSGPLVLVESDPDLFSQNPSVGHLTSLARALFSWQQADSPLGSFDIAARTMGSTGALNSATLLTSAGVCIKPDVGSQSKAGVARAHIVYERAGTGIYSLLVGELGGEVYVIDSTPVVLNSTDHNPTITKGAGDTRRHLITWERFFPLDGDHDLMLRAVNHQNDFLTEPVYLKETIGPNEQRPQIDGDGETFLIAYEAENSLGSGDRQIHAQRITLSGTTAAGSLDLTEPTVVVSAIPGVEEVDPAVAFAGPKFLVAWSRALPGIPFAYDLDFTALDADTADFCEPTATLAGGDGQGHRGAALAARRSTDSQAPANDDIVGVTWSRQQTTLPFSGSVAFAELEAVGPGSPLVNLGGGCGSAGVISTDGAFAIGSGDFSVSLSTLGPLAEFAVLNGSQVQPFLTCGTCDWVPFVFASLHDLASGTATVPLDIPCNPVLEGVPFLFQWTVLYDVGTGCLSPEISATDILQGTLEF